MNPLCINGSRNAVGLFLSIPVSVWHGSVLLTTHTPTHFFISFTNTEEFSHPCLVK